MGPQYIPSWEGHHTTELYGKYPLQLVSPHPRFSFHTMGDGKGSWTDDVKDHRMLIDGHHYWILRLNSRDAEARGIAEATSSGPSTIAERSFWPPRSPSACPGTVHCYESCRRLRPAR